MSKPETRNLETYPLTQTVAVKQGRARLRSYLTESVHKFLVPKSIPAQVRQLIQYVSDDKG